MPIPGAVDRHQSERRPIALVLVGLALAAAGCRHLEPLSAAASHVAVPVGDRCSWEARRADGGCDVYDVTLGELFAMPGEFHGQPTRVRGFVTLAFEQNTLCENDTPAAACLWIDVDGLGEPGFRKGWAEVEAQFDGEDRGHFGCCRGTLGHVRRVTRLKN